MAVTGNKKETGSYTKTYGFVEYKILGANLSNKKLKELGFYIKEEDEDKEREFVAEKDGVKRVMIEFACADAKGKTRRLTFFIEDRPARNKEGNERDLYLYINTQGKTMWSVREDRFEGIFENPYFTGVDDAYSPRRAMVGEEQFMLFMRTAMKINYKDGGTIQYNLKKFFNGNFKELNDDLQTDYLGSIVVATTIRIKQTEEGIKEQEAFYPYAFVSGDAMKVIESKKEFTPADVDAIHQKIKDNKGKKGKERTYVTPLEEMIAKMTDAEYGCKDVYHLGVVKEYVSTEHIETAKASIVIDSEDNDSQDDNSSLY